VKERLDALGFEPAAVKLEEITPKLRSESAKWAKVIQAAGIKPG
jgi:tripartite-type tricarboxylate transporter receptor subunit TctC